MQLRLFPKSNFPFEAFFQQTDNISESLANDSRSADGIPNDLSDNRETLRYGISQAYQPQGWDGRYRFRAESITTDDNGDVEYGDFLRFFGGHRLGANQFDVDLFYEDIDRETPDDDRQTLLTELEHRYRPAGETRLFVRNRLSLEDETNVLLGDREFNRQSIEFNSFATWVPPKYQKLSLTSNFQVQNARSKTSFETAKSDGLFANLSGVYDYSREWSATVSAGVDAQNYNGVGLDLAQYNEFVQLRYNPDTIELGQYTYNWSGSGSLQQDHGARFKGNTVGLSLGHGLNRRFQVGQQGSAITLTGNQLLDHRRLRTNFQDVGRESLRLDQQIGVRYSRTSGPTQFFSSLRYNDSRELADNPRVFQSLNFQFSGSIKMGRDAVFSGNVSVAKNLNESTIEPSMLRDEPGRITFSDEDNITVNLNYFHNRVFGLKRLRFESELIILDREIDRQDDNLDRLLNSQRVEQQTWTNRLVYRIGLLDVRLVATVSHYDVETNQSLMLEVSRAFAGQF